MATFGQTGTGTNHSNSSGGVDLLNRSTETASTPASNGTLASIVANLYLTSSGTGHAVGLVYNSSGTLLATGDIVAFTNTSAAPITCTFSGANAISLTAGTKYTYGILIDKPTSNTINWTRQTVSSTTIKDTITYPTPENPISGSPSTVSGPIDMYVNYTPSTTNTTNFFQFL